MHIICILHLIVLYLLFKKYGMFQWNSRVLKISNLKRNAVSGFDSVEVKGFFFLLMSKSIS